MSRRHATFRRYFPRKVTSLLAQRDQRHGLDWTNPTRLDQEINRCFVYWKTTRSEMSGAHTAAVFMNAKAAGLVLTPESLLADVQPSDEPK